MSRLVGILPADVNAMLVDADRDGLVRIVGHGRRRVGLSATGRARVERLLSEEIDLLGVRDELSDAYRGFEPVNRQVLAVCTSWQVVTIGSTVVPNDHTDADHDAEVLRRFEDLHLRAAGVARRLGELSPRLSGYDGRLTMAHERISMGDTRWLTRPTVDSYHSIWFELHENLLATLGRERSDEPDN